MADYSQLVNKGGTVYNTAANVAYSTPDQLAVDLGIQSNQIQWGQIKSNPNYTPPNTSAPVSTSQLTSGPTNYPTGTPPDNGSSVVSGIIAGQNAGAVTQSPTPNLDMATTGDYSQDPNYQQAQQQYNKSVSDYQTQANALPSQADLLTQQQQATGATADLAQVSSLKQQLADATAAYNNQYQQIGSKGIQDGVPAVFYEGQQAAQQRQAAVLTAGIATRLAAAQGNYDQAEALAEKTADLQFHDAQNKIDNMKSFIQLNQDNLSRAEKVAMSKMQTQANQLQQQLDQRKTAVTFALTNGITKPFYNVGGTIYRSSDGKAYSTPEQFFKDGGALDFGDVQVVDGTATETKKSVVDLANKYPDAGISLSDPLGVAQQKVLKSKIYQQSTRLVGGGSGGSPGLSIGKGTGIVAGKSVPAAIAGDVEDVLSGRNTLYNIRQTMGRTNAAAAYMQQMRDSIRGIDPTFDFVASDAGGKFVSSTYYQKAVGAINSVMPNIDKVVDLSNQVSRVGVKGVDALLQKGQIQIGNKQVANFHEAQKLIADEIGLALGQGTVSDMKLQLGFDVTDTSVSPEIFASNMQLVKEFIQNRKSGLEQQRYSSPTSQPAVSAGSVITYQGKNYLVDAQGNMTPK